MWTQFFLENIHFALYLFTALVMFSIFWLYFDAWTARKTSRELLRASGFLILSISFILSAGFLESTVLPNAWIPLSLVQLSVVATRIIGYLLVCSSLVIDPIQPRPTYKAIIGFSLPLKITTCIYPFLGLTTAILYWRKATSGLENHLKRIAVGFFVLSLAEFISLTELLQDTNTISLYEWVKPFGFFWILQHIVLTLGTAILAKWIFSYLLKRIQSQLFIIFTTGILIIFVITSTVFTGLLLNNIQKQTETQLASDAKVMQYALTNKQNETKLTARALAQNPIIQSSVDKKSHEALVKISEKYIVDNNVSEATILTSNAQVLIHASDADHYGESLSDDPIIKLTLEGTETVSLTTKQGVLAPEIQIQATSPIKKDDTVIGVVQVTQKIDNAFLDGIKNTTGFESSLYANNKLSATTLISVENHRPIGTKEESDSINKTVLKEGKNHIGSSSINNTLFSGAYIPLKNSNQTPIGMLFVGKPQLEILQSAGASIELTFIVTIILIVLTIIPTHFITRSIAKQLE